MQKSVSLFAVLLISLAAIGQHDFFYHSLSNALSDKALLRTRTFEKWDPLTQSWINLISTYAYDRKGRNVYSKANSSDPFSGQMSSLESILRYDNCNNLIYYEQNHYLGNPSILDKQEVESWIYEGGRLMKYENKYELKSEFGVQKARFENLYEYDQQGIKTSEIQIGYGKYENPEYKWEQKWNIDQNGCVKGSVEKFFDWDGSWSFIRGDSLVFDRNMNCYTLEVHSYYWSNSSSYKLGFKTVIELDNNGFTLKHSTYRPGFPGDEELSLAEEIQYERDSVGNILYEITLNKLEPQSQSFNEYDLEGRLVLKLRQVYDPMNKIWVNEYQELNFYNDRDQFEGNIWRSFDSSGDLVSQSESKYEYNSTGNILDYLSQWNWDTVSNTYRSFIQHLYEWNPDSSLSKATLSEQIIEIEEHNPNATISFSAEESYEYRCDGALVRSKFTVLEGVREYYQDSRSSFDYYLVADCESFADKLIEITLFPNPASEGLNIHNVTPLGNTLIQILGSDGRIVYSQGRKLSNYFSIDLLKWKAGTYLFQLWTEDDYYFSKFVKL